MSENTRKTNGFGIFPAPKGIRFWFPLGIYLFRNPIEINWELDRNSEMVQKDIEGLRHVRSWPRPRFEGGEKIKPGKERGGKRSSTGIRYHFLSRHFDRPGQKKSGLPRSWIPNGPLLRRPGLRKHKENKWVLAFPGAKGAPFLVPFWDIPFPESNRN